MVVEGGGGSRLPQGHHQRARHLIISNLVEQQQKRGEKMEEIRVLATYSFLNTLGTYPSFSFFFFTGKESKRKQKIGRDKGRHSTNRIPSSLYI